MLFCSVENVKVLSFYQLWWPMTTMSRHGYNMVVMGLWLMSRPIQARPLELAQMLIIVIICEILMLETPLEPPNGLSHRSMAHDEACFCITSKLLRVPSIKWYGRELLTLVVLAKVGNSIGHAHST